MVVVCSQYHPLSIVIAIHGCGLWQVMLGARGDNGEVWIDCIYELLGACRFAAVVWNFQDVGAEQAGGVASKASSFAST